MAQMADDLLASNEQVDVGGLDVNAPATENATIGSKAPAFSLPSLTNGSVTTLKSFESKPTVLNFWASTCEICTQEMPAFQQVDSDFAGRVNFVGADVADPNQKAQSFARSLGVRYSLVADAQGQVAADYRVDGLPVIFILSPGGAIVARHIGALDHDELVAVLEMEFPNLPQNIG